VKLIKGETMKTNLLLRYISLCLLCFTLNTQAADRQTHFYGDLIMSLSADLDPYSAIQYAFGDEMIDGGLFTHPMGLDAARILSHFQGNPITMKTDGGFLKEGLAIATIDHPLLYKLLDEGLRTGNKAMIGAARHRLIDTFFHAGWSNFWGHMEGGHRPDMPHEEIYKSQKCFQAIMELTFLLRDMSDAPVVTTNMKSILARISENKLAALYKISKTDNLDHLTQYMRNRPGLYSKLLWQLPELKNAFFSKIENSDQYQELAFKELFKSLKGAGIISLNENEYITLKALFHDLKDRSDLSVQDSFRLSLFRILQSLDKTTDTAANDLPISEDVLAKVHIEKLLQYNSSEAMWAKINYETSIHENNLHLLVADIEDFQTRIGGWKRSSDLSFTEKTTLDSIVGDVLSWIQIFDPENGKIHQVEDPRAGDIPDLRDVESFVQRNYNNQPEFLTNFVAVLKNKNGEQLHELAKIKSLAEAATLATIHATKDIIPNARNTSTQRVNFENDDLTHACFANECRELAVRNAIAKLFGIDAKLGKLGTIGFVEYLKDSIKKIKLSFNKAEKLKAEQEHAQLEKLMNAYLVEIGFATVNEKGVIVTELDLNPNLIKVNPSFTFKGLFTWFKWSGLELSGLILRADTKWKKFRTLEIVKRINTGSKVKDRVVFALNEKYGNGDPVPENHAMNYPQLSSGQDSVKEEGHFKLAKNGNNIIFNVKCASLGL
jgi:hypothetical protein